MDTTHIAAQTVLFAEPACVPEGFPATATDLRPTIQMLHLLHQSQGIKASKMLGLGAAVRRALRHLRNLGAQDPLIHEDGYARQLAALAGAHALCFKNRVFIGPTVGTALGPTLDQVLKHELVHIAQLRKGIATGRRSSADEVECEAHKTAAGEFRFFEVVHGADIARFYGLWWLVPLAAAAYVLLRPNVANAPGPGDKVYPSVSEAQVAGEALALFAVPGAAFGVAGRLGLGFYAGSAAAGSTTMMSFRGVQDLGQGRFSGVQVYVFDAVTGAVLGVVVPGGIRLVGRAGTQSLDWLATQGMRRSDLALTRLIAERAATRPLAQAELNNLMQSRNLSGRAAEWWLNRRGLILLWRGQGAPSTSILSPIARENGVAASQAMLARMRAAGLTDSEIAAYTASWHTQPVPRQFTLPELAGQPLGAAGIPTTRIPGVAANFGDEGIVYIIRLPKNAAIKVPKWGLAVENEWVVLNQVPEGSVVGYMPAQRIPALEVNEAGQIILAP